MQNMTSDIGLVTPSFENQWDLRFKRGRTRADILSMIDANRKDIKWGNNVVVLGGTNDMNLRSVQPAEKMKVMQARMGT